LTNKHTPNFTGVCSYTTIMKINKLFTTAAFILISLTAFSQVKVTGYSTHALGVSFPLHKKFSVELKTYPNQWEIENVDFELAGFYHFKPGDFHRFSAGAGLGLNPFVEAGSPYLSFPIVLEFYPFPSFRRVSFLFEMAPEIYFDDHINLRYLWGIRYAFAKKE